MDNLIITGQFMEYAGVTRNTLIHYDNIGLLRPVETNDRGDRFYHPFQLYQILIVKLFQTAGMELKDIKSFVGEIKDNKIIDSYEAKIELFDKLLSDALEKYRESSRSYHFLDKLLKCMNAVKDLDPNGPPVIKTANINGHLIYRKLEKPTYNVSEEYCDNLFGFVKENHKLCRDCMFPIITKFGKREFLRGEYRVTELACLTNAKSGVDIAEHDDVPILWLRRIGDLHTIDEALDTIREYLNCHPEYELANGVGYANNFVSISDGNKSFSDRVYIAPLKPRDSEFRTIPKPSEEDVEKSKKLYNYDGRLLSSGAFIKYVGISRNALNIYEKKKLFEPQLVKENGYKMYGLLQIYQCSLLKILQQAGYSLEECRSLLRMDISSYSGYESIISQLIEQRDKVKKQLSEIAVSKLVIKGLKKVLSTLKKSDGQNIAVFNKKVYYTSYQTTGMIATPEYVELANKVFAESVKSDSFMTFPMGSYLDVESGESGLYTIADPSAVKKEDLGANYCYWSGEYYTVYHRIKRSDYLEHFKNVKKQIESDHDLKISGRVINIFLNATSTASGEPELSMLSLFPIVRV